MKVKLSELKDAVANVLLFAGDKKSASGGLIKISQTEQYAIQLEAYDDHTFLCTRVGVLDDYHLKQSMYVDAKELKAVVATLEDVEAEFTPALLLQHADPGVFDQATQLMLEPAVPRVTCWLSIDRWKKLGSMKPAGLPLQLTTHSDNGFPYASFKYGGNTLGLLSFLDEDILREEGLA